MSGEAKKFQIQLGDTYMETLVTIGAIPELEFAKEMIDKELECLKKLNQTLVPEESKEAK